MHSAVIAATGLYTPPQSVSNAELVEAFNTYVGNFNTEHAAAIEAGEVEALTPSSVEFIEKASGIKSRFVVDKAGVIDPAVMTPRIPERPDDEISVMAEIGVAAARDALARWGKDASQIDEVAKRPETEAEIQRGLEQHLCTLLQHAAWNRNRIQWN